MRIVIAAIGLLWMSVTPEVAAFQEAEQSRPTTPPVPAGKTWTGVLDLGVPAATSPELFEAFVAWRVTGPDDLMAAERAIQSWRDQEAAFEAREFEALRRDTMRITEGVQGRWFQEAARRQMFVGVARERSRLADRRRARESALIATLASIAKEEPSIGPWKALAGECEAARSCGILSAMPGAQYNLSAEVAGMLGAPTYPTGDDPLSVARRSYLCEMAPLWSAKQASWADQLEKGYSTETANPPTRKAAMERLSDACLAIQLANEKWARHFASLVGGAEGSHLEWRLLSPLCPTASIGWACSFESLLEAAEGSGDPITARAAVLNLKSRCEMLRDLAWQTDRTNLARMVAGRGVPKDDPEEGRTRLLAGMLEEVTIHRLILEDGLGVDLSDDPCLMALERIAESVNSGSPSWLGPSEGELRKLFKR